MQDSNGVKLQVFFPKSSEDHRLQLVSVNGSVFAIFFTPLDSQGPINLHCEDWSLVLLQPIKSKSDIEIYAQNIICLNEVESEDGVVVFNASNRLVKNTNVKPPIHLTEKATNGTTEIGEDPGALINYFKLYQTVLEGVRGETPNIPSAQEKFITSLVLLAAKIENSNELDLIKVFNVWDIPNQIV